MQNYKLKNLILDSTTYIQSPVIPVRLLIEICSLFGFNKNQVRVCLSRLNSAKILENGQHGFYQLGLQSKIIRDQTQSWSLIEKSITKSWDKNWYSVNSSALKKSDRTNIVKRDMTLNFLGLKKLVKDLYIRPGNFRSGFNGFYNKLNELHPDHNLLCSEIKELDPHYSQKAMTLWNIETYSKNYGASLINLKKSTERLAKLSNKKAMVESFLIGGRVIKQLALDPKLPFEMLPNQNRKELIATMLKYDNQATKYWAKFMENLGILHNEKVVYDYQKGSIYKHFSKLNS